ncbi:HAD family hydrolase, partial [Vibrio natriegens]
GYKLGIATADTKAATLYSLEQSGLLGLFDFIGYSDGDIAPKPAPALMNAFCAHCDLTPDQVVMFGDTVSDMVFGRNAGARRIGVLTGTATEEELRPYADFVLHSVADFSPSLLETA